eukprot:TRINITY_DN1518_c0_g1_i1.p1 TRINITY_DN1518_c0_g1~~TRINITY_DN1518_c0_g1_i1.p1  ORF type:complete len:508 (+),score=166.94 TRINITY_DN1518_c0_g1_i1:1514-3037(+)
MAEKAEKSAKFATELWDGFDTISKHTANELQFCKDVHKFFKRRVEIEQEFAKSMSKLAQKNPLSPQGTLKRAWEDVLCHTQNVSNIHTNTATQITEKVTDSVAGLIKDVETTRKQLVNEGTALNNEYSSNVDSLKKAKSNYEKACKDSELARKTYDAVKVDGVTKQKDLPKFEKDAAKKKLAAQQADEQYKKRVEDTNNFLEVYYTEKMPKILSQFEHLESVRIHMIKSNLRKYLQVLEYVPSLHQKEAKLLQDTVEKINNEADIDLYCKQYKTGEEIPQPFEYEPYIEGSDQNIQKKLNKLEQRQQSRFAKLKSGVNMIAALPNSPGPQRASGPKEDASFCVPIQTLMDKQKAKYPDLDVPRLLVLLSETIIKLEGTKTEGIFRVPASADDVKALRERLDDGDYECLKQVQNVHTPCALFKLWLRELPEPIIPTALYETCTENPTKGLELLQQQSPPVNLKVIAFIIDFIHKLATPEITEITTPVWLVVLSDQLLIVALVGLYPTN